MSRHMRSPSILTLTFCLIVPGSAVAQETRAEEIAAKQKEKAGRRQAVSAQRLRKNHGTAGREFRQPAERLVSGLRQHLPRRRFQLSAPDIGISTGRNAVWDVHGLYSLKNYKQIEFGTSTARGTAEGASATTFKVGWLDAPQVGFYGIGMGDGPGGRITVCRTVMRRSRGACVRPGGRVWRERSASTAIDTNEGSGRHPSIETVYDAVTAPGLGSSPSFIRTEGLAAIDTRASSAYAARGGFYGIRLANYADTGRRLLIPAARCRS